MKKLHQFIEELYLNGSVKNQIYGRENMKYINESMKMNSKKGGKEIPSWRKLGCLVKVLLSRKND